MAVTIHLARWLVPVSMPPIENAGIAVSEGVIAGVDTNANLLGRFQNASIVDHGDSIIMPPLVNAHCHLELSNARGRIPPGTGFYSWLKMVIDFKAGNQGSDQSRADTAVLEAVSELRENGVAVLADTGNTDLAPRILSGLGREHMPCCISFREIIHPMEGVPELLQFSGFNQGDCRMAAVSPHSVYTCSRPVLRKIKEWCLKNRLPFSIHCAESPEEMEFVRSATGPLAEILREKGRDTGAFFKVASSPVKLLEETGLLDPSTICVHCVFLEEDDLETLAETGCHVCLCPGSNEFIGTGTPGFERLFSAMPSRICLGTDSLASNRQLSILAEMERIVARGSGVSAELVVRAATLNGAGALGLSEMAGSLEPGKMAAFVVLEGAFCKRNEIFEFICCGHDSFQLKLVTSFSN